MKVLARQLKRWAQRTWSDCRAQDLIEYALLAGFVALVGGTAFSYKLAPTLAIIFNAVVDTLPTP